MNYEIATEQDVLNKYLAVAGGGKNLPSPTLCVTKNDLLTAELPDNVSIYLGKDGALNNSYTDNELVNYQDIRIKVMYIRYILELDTESLPKGLSANLTATCGDHFVAVTGNSARIVTWTITDQAILDMSMYITLSGTIEKNSDATEEVLLICNNVIKATIILSESLTTYIDKQIAVTEYTISANIICFEAKLKLK